MLLQMMSIYFCKLMSFNFVLRHLLPRISSDQIMHLFNIYVNYFKRQDFHKSSAERRLGVTYSGDINSS